MKSRPTRPALLPYLGMLLGLWGGWVTGQPRHFAHFSTRDGLSDNRVQCLLPDRAGFLWVGTAHGLNRFDGHAFRTYLPGDGLPALSNASINALAQDRSGHLWIATDDGLCLLDLRSGRTHTWRNTGRADGSLPNGLVRDVHIDADGTLWVACDNRDLARLDPTSGKFIRLPFRDFVLAALPTLSADAYLNIDRIQAKDDDGLWLFSNRGLFSYDVRRRRFLHHPPGEPGTGTCAQSFASIGTQLVSHDTCTGQVHFQPFSGMVTAVEEVPTSQALVRAGGSDWLIAQGNLFWQGHGQPWQRIAADSDPDLGPVGPLQVVAVDAHGNAWIGGAQGLWRCAPGEQHFHAWTLPALPESQFMNAIDLDAKNRLALDAAGARLHVIQGRESASSLPLPGRGTLLAQDPKGQVWISAGGRLYRWEAGRQTLQPWDLPAGLEAALKGGHFQAMAVDAGGRYWWGLNHAGILVWDPQKNTWWRPGAKDGFISNTVTAILAGPDGEMWIGTEDFGLYRYQPATGRFVLFQHETEQPVTSLAAFIVTDLARDGQDRLWVATDPGGISIYDPALGPEGGFHTLGVAAGLPSGRCQGMCRDRNGDMWVLTSGGLSWIDHRSFRIRTFSPADGLPADLSPHLSLLAGGRIRIGSRSGFFEFQPEALVDRQVDPRILACGFRIFDRECLDSLAWQDGQPITLSHRENFFSLDFATADLALTHKVSYAYRLLGLDAGWQSTGKAHVASYTNVPPGHYTFEVRAGLEGDWAPAGLSIPIVITPPYWQTWWFRVLAALLIGGIALALYRWRVRGIRREAALRNEFNQQLARTEMAALRAQMNPHFVFNCLSSINRYILVNQPDDASAYLTKFARLIRLILDNSRTETVLLSKELEAIALYVEMEQMRFNHRFDYRLEVAPEVQPDHVEVPPLLIQPFIENAIWHGLMHKKGHGQLQVHLSLAGQRLCVRIEDDGIGRQKALELKSRSATVNKSHGVKLSAERLTVINRLYGTEATVETTDLYTPNGEAAGTRVLIRF